MTLPPHYGALVDTTSVTPTTSSVTAGSTTSTNYPATSYPVVSFFPLKHSFPTLHNTPTAYSHLSNNRVLPCVLLRWKQECRRNPTEEDLGDSVSPSLLIQPFWHVWHVHYFTGRTETEALTITIILTDVDSD
jgi:hypothetical protein